MKKTFSPAPAFQNGSSKKTRGYPESSSPRGGSPNASYNVQRGGSHSINQDLECNRRSYQSTSALLRCILVARPLTTPNAFIISPCNGQQQWDPRVQMYCDLFERQARTTMSIPRIRTSSCTRPPSELHGLHFGRSLSSNPRPTGFSSRSRSTRRSDVSRRPKAPTSSSLTR